MSDRHKGLSLHFVGIGPCVGPYFMLQLPKTAQIIEVGPRDGLQNEPGVISLADKIEFIRQLSQTGLTEIEAGAFVHPKWVPQMADSEDVFQGIRESKDFHPSVTYSALVPNEKGMRAALACGVRKVAVFTAASETFNQKNINCSMKESIERFAPVLKLAQENGVAVRGYVSTAFVCPYEGVVHPEKTKNAIQRLLDLGIEDISIGDTIGKATPIMVNALLDLLIVKSSISKEYFTMHFHDTYGMALTNIYESLKFYVNRFDASAGGLGGCPYAPGASGNVATNDVVWFLENLGVATGVDLEKLNQATAFIQGILSRPLSSRVFQATYFKT